MAAAPPLDDPGASPSVMSRPAPQTRAIGRYKPMMAVMGGVGLAGIVAGLGIIYMKRDIAARSDQEVAAPSDASQFTSRLPSSGEILATRPPSPMVPDYGQQAPPPAQPQAVAPARREALSETPKPVDDLKAAALRSAWEAYYRNQQALADRRFNETQVSLRAGLATAWGAQGQGGQQGGDGTQTVAVSAPGAAGVPQRPRPGWLDQGPSDPGRAWLMNPVTPPLSRYSLMKGDTIPCRVEKNISSELGGQFTATVTRDVKDEAGNTLIPWRTRLVGSYDQHTGQGQERLPIGFTDMVFPGVGADKARLSLALGSMPGSDGEGASGFNDQVNRHTSRILFSALVSALAGSASTVAPQVIGEPGSAASTIASGAGQGLGSAGQNIVGRGVNTASTLEIRRGYSCSMEITQHMALPGRWVDGVGFVP